MKQKRIITSLVLMIFMVACEKNDLQEVPYQDNETETVKVQDYEAQDKEEYAAISENDSATEDAEEIMEYVPQIPRYVTGEEYGKTRSESYYEEAPQYGYSAEEWLVNGKFDYPFDIYEDTSEMMNDQLHARFHVPQKALDGATTYDLLQAVKIYPLVSYVGHEEAIFVLSAYLSRINMAQELFLREDFAETLLEDYKSAHYIIGSMDKFSQMGHERESGIVLEEVMLATNEVYMQLSDDMKQQTLEAVLEKLEERLDDRTYANFGGSYFFSSISEYHIYGVDSLWYDYLSGAEFEGKYDKFINDYRWHSHEFIFAESDSTDN